MPDVTPRLGLKKPLGNEVVSRAAYNENIDLIDQNAAKASDLAAHLADVASNAHGKGASMVGIENATGSFSSTNVEGALSELGAAIPVRLFCQATDPDTAASDNDIWFDTANNLIKRHSSGTWITFTAVYTA
jgi:hypothetical protein